MNTENRPIKTITVAASLIAGVIASGIGAGEARPHSLAPFGPETSNL